MHCIKCGNEINCRLSIATEDSERPIETSWQWWECKSCGSKYYGLLEDSHVNMFDDRLLHQGYIADEGKWNESLKWALKCPDNHNTGCPCEVHSGLTYSLFQGISAWYTYD